MNVSKHYLERKIKATNNWLLNHPETHHAYSLKMQNRNYYIDKLCTMDELGLEVIKI